MLQFKKYTFSEMNLNVVTAPNISALSWFQLKILPQRVPEKP